MNIDMSKFIGENDSPIDMSEQKIEPLVKKREKTEYEKGILNMLREECDDVVSFSKLNKSCAMEYYFSYVAEDEEGNRIEKDRDGVYGIMGGICHDINEQIYLGEIKKEDGLGEFVDKFDRLKHFKVDFPSEKIRNSYFNNIESYYENIEVPEYDGWKLYTEVFVWNIYDFKKSGIKLGVYGYIDLLYIHEDGMFKVGDFKTSSIGDYTKKSNGEEKEKRIGYGRQLVLYADMLNNNKLILPNGKANVKGQYGYYEIYWNMLKYCNITLKPIPVDKILSVEVSYKTLEGLKATELKSICREYFEDYELKKKYKADVLEFLEDKNVTYHMMSGAGLNVESPVTITKKFENIERQNMVNAIVKNCDVYINILGVDIEKFKETGKIKDIPKELKEYIEIEDCILQYEHTYDKTIEMYNWMLDKYKLQKEMIEHNQFIADDKNEFFCNHLCAFPVKCPVNSEKQRKRNEKYSNIL